MGSVLIIVTNYAIGLFGYMILGFFSDIHNIRDELEYGVLKAFPQEDNNNEA